MRTKLSICVSNILGHTDEIVGIVPWRDNILVATTTSLILLEPDEDIMMKMQILAKGIEWPS